MIGSSKQDFSQSSVFLDFCDGGVGCRQYVKLVALLYDDDERFLGSWSLGI